MNSQCGRFFSLRNKRFRGDVLGLHTDSIATVSMWHVHGIWKGYTLAQERQNNEHITTKAKTRGKHIAQHPMDTSR